MKPLEFMKAMHKGLSAHFGKAATHHEKMAASETAMSEDESTKAAAHKAMADHCKAFGKADVGGEGEKACKAFGAGMEDEHDKCGNACSSKAGEHTKMAAMHKAHGEHCGKMATMQEDSEKALKTVSDDPATTPEAMQKAIGDSQSAILDGVKELLKTLPKGVTSEEVTAIAKGLIDALPSPDGARVATGMPGLHLMGRDGNIVEMSKAATGTESSTGGI